MIKLDKDPENEIKRHKTIGWKKFGKNRPTAGTSAMYLNCNLYSHFMPGIIHGKRQVYNTRYYMVYCECVLQ